MNRHDIERLMETIDAKGFTALSSGIGLGDLKPVTSARGKAPVVAPTRDQGAQPPIAARADGYRPGFGPHPAAKVTPKPTPPAPPRPKTGLSRRVLAYGLDFCFVSLSLAAALTLATLLAAVRTGETDNVLGLAPVQWVIGTSAYILLAVVYGAFLAYGLLFKLLAGRTCGESLMRILPRGTGQKTRQNGLRGVP